MGETAATPGTVLNATADAIHDWAQNLRWRRDTCEQLAHVVLAAAAPLITAAERERVVHLAEDLDAEAWSNRGPMAKRVKFASLIEEK